MQTTENLRRFIQRTLLGGAILVPLYFMIPIFLHDDWQRLVVSDFYFLAQKLFILVALFFAISKIKQKRPELARFWYFIFAAIIAYTIGDFFWMMYEVMLKQEPFPSIADLFYLLFYPLMWLGLYNYPRGRLEKLSATSIYLDNAIVIIGSGLVMWSLTIAPTINSNGENLLSYVVSILYPVLGMILLWSVFIFFRIHLNQGASVATLLLGLGLMADIASDTMFAIFYTTYQSGSWIDLGWVIGCILIMCSAVFQMQEIYKQSGESIETKLETWLQQIRAWPIYLPFVWLGLAYIILLTNIPMKGENLYIILGIGILIGLVITRQMLTISENQRLIQKVQKELIERQEAQEALRLININLDQMVIERTNALQKANDNLKELNELLKEEVDERRKTEINLYRQIKNQELISTISSSFINLPTEGIDAEVNRVLSKTGLFFGADRSYIFQFQDENTLVSNTYEWSTEGVQPQINDLQAISVHEVPWFMEKLSQGETINLSSLEEIPTEYDGERLLLEEQGIQSLIIVPLEWNQSLVGFFGFDAVQQPKVWSNEDIAVIKIIGEILMMAIQRKISRKALSQYAQRLKILHEIDQAILSAVPSQKIIANALHNLNTLIPNHSAVLVKVNTENKNSRLIFENHPNEFRITSIAPEETPSTFLAINQMLESLERFESPGERIPEMIVNMLIPDHSQGSNPAHILTFPLKFHDRINGFICLSPDSISGLTNDQRESINEVIHSLEIALQNAQMRQELNQRLKWMEASLLEKEVLLKEIHHRVKNNLQVISSLLNLQTQSVQDPGAKSALIDSQMRVRSMALIHEKLYQSERLSHIKLSAYINSLSTYLFDSYHNNNSVIKLVIDVGEIEITLDDAVTIGLILNELISNSLKHAFPGNQNGEIGIVVRQLPETGKLLLKYHDTGIGLPDDFKIENARSLGMRLIYNLSRQLQADFEMINQGGINVELCFPIKLWEETVDGQNMKLEGDDDGNQPNRNGEFVYGS